MPCSIIAQDTSLKLFDSNSFSEENYTQLYELFMQVPAPLTILLGPDFYYSMANPPYERMVGRKVLGKKILEAFTEEEVGAFIPLVENVYNTGIPYIGREHLLVIPNEEGIIENKYINVGYYPFLNSEGVIKGVYCMHEDVTQQVRARKIVEESTLHTALERMNFRNLFKQTPEMVCILKGPEHTFEFVNEAHVRALGFDATGMTVREAQPESVEVHGILDNVYRTGKTAELHEILVTLGTKQRYFNLTYAARRDLDGEINGVMILGMEVTQNVENSKAIKAALEMNSVQMSAFELALKEAPLAESLGLLTYMVEKQTEKETYASVLILDKEGKHLLHGAGPKLPNEYNNIVDGIAIGMGVGSCGTAAYLKKTVISTDIETDPYWKDYKDLARKFGLRSCWSTPIFSSQGKLLGTFALYHKESYQPAPRDEQIVHLATRTAAILIERHHLTKSRNEAESLLQEAVRSRDKFLSLASHELKTPLTSLKLMTQMNHRFIDAGKIDKVQINVTKSDKLIGRLDNLIEDMLDISRIQLGKLPINMERANLHQTAYEVVDKMQHSFTEISQSEIYFDTNDMHESFGIFDVMRIEQVITNLLQNALKYAKGMGVAVVVKSIGDNLRLSVIDKGPGIPKEYQQKIFQRFERADDTKVSSGLGLGLFICNQIIEAHEGKLWVESEIGKGSAFIFELPKNPQNKGDVLV